ncbi:MAG: type I glyceraldehyde-3-phosphate dehydrogenase [Alphaproteobacteria bacterium]
MTRETAPARKKATRKKVAKKTTQKKPLRIAVNGCGRIGRLVIRAFVESERDDLQIVVLNSTTSADFLSHLLRYDSVHGRFAQTIKAETDSLKIGRHQMQVLCERDPGRIDWQSHKIDVVLECSGAHKTREELRCHLKSGAKRVLVSAPAIGAERTVVYGLNQHDIQPGERIISSASCTTNCLAPLLGVLDRNFRIKNAFATTIHAYTADQRLVDGSHPDKQRARAAPLSIIPTTSGLAEAVCQVLPHLKGRIDGAAIRVPVANVSFLEVTATLERATTVHAVNRAFAAVAQSGGMNGILSIAEAPLVSADFNHDPHSATFDPFSTRVVDRHFLRIAAWYDNEWGFAHRMLDLAACL